MASVRELVLMGIVAVMYLIDMILAMCLSLVIPKHLITTDFVKNVPNRTELMQSCYESCSGEYDEPCYHGVLHGDMIVYSYPNKDALVYDPEAYTSVVAVIERKYREDQAYRFVCTGTAISNQWLFVGENCLRGITDWKELKVRSHSVKWYEGGLLRSVETVSAPLESLIAIKVSEPMDVEPKMMLSDFSVLEAEIAESVGWEIDEPMSRVRQMGTIYWAASSNCVSDMAAASSAPCNDIPSGCPILLQNSYVGVQTCTSGRITIRDFDIPNIVNWFEELRNENKTEKYTPKKKPTSYCKYYSKEDTKKDNLKKN